VAVGASAAQGTNAPISGLWSEAKGEARRRHALAHFLAFFGDNFTLGCQGRL